MIVQEKFSQLLVFSLSLSLMGCGTQLYGQCEPPKENLELLFKSKIEGHPFSHSFCIVCNPDIEPDAYGDWALEMGAPQAPDSVDNLHPCLYVYPSAEQRELEIDSLELCEALVCEGSASYNDMVSKENGNVNLDPLLE